MCAAFPLKHSCGSCILLQELLSYLINIETTTITTQVNIFVLMHGLSLFITLS